MALNHESSLGFAMRVRSRKPVAGGWALTCHLAGSSLPVVPDGEPLRSRRRSRWHRGRTALVSIFVSTAIASCAGASASPVPTHPGSMETPRADATATLLADGRVLIAGGTTAALGSDAVGPLASAEIYDPTTGTFTATGSMTTPRSGQTATLLADGRVLLVGGQDPRATAKDFALADIYDSKSGTFSPVGPVSRTPYGGSATLLSDGRVLLVATYETTAQVFDPKSRTFSPTGSMTVVRFFGAQTPLADGRVLVTGGNDANSNQLASAEIYNPITGAFSPTGSMSTTRDDQSATLLTDGRVLIAGGTALYGETLASAELYDPGTGTFGQTGSMGTRRSSFTATRLSDGRVLVAGGYDVQDRCLAPAEIYDPKTGAFSPTGSMAQNRCRDTGTLLADGRVLVAGGEGNNSVLASAEIYDPKTGTFAPA